MRDLYRFDYWGYGPVRYGSENFDIGTAGGPDYTGRGPKGYQRSDELIAEEVCQILTDDLYVDASDIEVKVNDAEVTLTGQIESRGLKRRLEDLIDGVAGLRDIHNLVRVKVRSDSWGRKPEEGYLSTPRSFEAARMSSHH